MTTALYTWRDVERTLKKEGNPPWVNVSADTETLTITCLPQQKEEALTRLGVIFGTRFSQENSKLNLESPIGSARHLEVVIEPVLDADVLPRKHVIRPLWPDAATPPDNIPSLPLGSPKIVAFYSYKGGVGRTTTLLATLGSLIDQRKQNIRVLVVDADLEAPGLTWNLPGPPDRFSLLDLLAIVHDTEDWKANALPLAAERLRRNSESLELTNGQATFYFLPAHREDDQLFSPPITMDQVVRARGRAYVIAEVLAALGQKLEVHVVLVDLRAGVTEISSPLLLDPRVQSVLVTSSSHQSMEGTIRTLHQMKNRAKQETSPEVVLTMIPTTFTPLLTANITGRLIEALPWSAENPAEAMAQRTVHEVAFAGELVHFDSVETLLSELVPGTDLGKKVAPQLAHRLIPTPQKELQKAPPQPSKTKHHGLQAVATEATKLEYAEQNAEPGLLATPALESLIEQFPGSLPSAVVLGAKGAGKTFAWGQMVLAGLWQQFALSLATQGAQGSLIEQPGLIAQAHIFPLLGPQNTTTALAEKVRKAEQAVRSALGSKEKTLTQDALRAALAQGISSETDELQFWTTQTAARLGLPAEAGSSVDALVTALTERKVAVVLCVDGLEDAFQPSPQSPLSDDQRRLMRGLLQRFTIEIRNQQSRHLGVVTFIRRDLAQNAILQNFGQFESLYKRFSLNWSSTEALRLVAWLLQRAERAPIEPERIPLASYEELRDSLQSFWGERLGSAKSREAYTDRWVIAALSDFQGRLQPRDVVRLVRTAAETVKQEDKLTPASLRNALVTCSLQKVEELEIEIQALKPLFDRLRAAPEETKTIPFRAETFKLTPEDVAFLETQGVVIRVEEGELYMPEIVRHGLGFRMEGGRRARVLALYRASQAKKS